MSKRISHTGIIEHIEANRLQVRIIQASACAHCKAARLCNAAEQKEKLVDAYSPTPDKYAVGDEVDVIGTVGMGMQAVCLAFVVPLLLLLAAAIVTIRLTDDEPLAALAAIGVTVLWYIGLYLTRNRIARNFQFTVEQNL